MGTASLSHLDSSASRYGSGLGRVLLLVFILLLLLQPVAVLGQPAPVAASRVEPALTHGPGERAGPKARLLRGQAKQKKSSPIQASVSDGPQTGPTGTKLCPIRVGSGEVEGSPVVEETMYVECNDNADPDGTAPSLLGPQDVPPPPILLSPANNSSLNTLIPIKNIDARLSGVQISPRIDISTDPTFQSVDYWTIYCGWTERYYEHRQMWNLKPNTRSTGGLAPPTGMRAVCRHPTGDLAQRCGPFT